MGQVGLEEWESGAEHKGEVPVKELEEVTLTINYFGVGWYGTEAATSW